MNKFKSRGGLVEERKVQNFKELAGVYDVILNCTGLGSAELVQDKTLTPIRGQMIRVKAPWIKHFLYVDNHCWIIPGKETVVIGGTRQSGDSDTEIRPSDSEEIWKRACKYMPSLEGATWKWEWAGLRPARDSVRVEVELMKF